MTAKRFTTEIGSIKDNLNNCLVSLDLNDLSELLNELHEENKQIKDLIHTMLKQIDAENITSDSAIYSAKIIFSRNEFNLIRELWKR